MDNSRRLMTSHRVSAMLGSVRVGFAQDTNPQYYI